MPEATVHGVNVHYDTVGSGAALMLLMPQSTGPVGIRPVVHAFAERYRVITLEHRGTGRSAPAPSELSMDVLADDAIAVLDALAVASVRLVCHSTGCGIGLSIAGRCPQRVAALVLATPWSHADTHLSVMQSLRKAAAVALEPEQYARFNAALLFPPDYRRANEDGFARMARDARASPQDPADIARRLDAILAFDARSLWPKIECPTLVVSAGDDQLMPDWFAERTAASIDGAELVEFNSGGHMLPETRREDFTATVLGFLDRASPSND